MSWFNLDTFELADDEAQRQFINEKADMPPGARLPVGQRTPALNSTVTVVPAIEQDILSFHFEVIPEVQSEAPKSH